MAVAGRSRSSAYGEIFRKAAEWAVFGNQDSRGKNKKDSQEQGRLHSLCRRVGNVQGGLAARVHSKQAPCTHPLLILFKRSLRKGFPLLMPGHLKTQVPKDSLSSMQKLSTTNNDERKAKHSNEASSLGSQFVVLEAQQVLITGLTVPTVPHDSQI